MMVRAVASAKAKEYSSARRYLERVLALPSNSEQKADAYYWLSEISETTEEKRDHLQSALAYNGAHHRARKALAILDGKIQAEEIIDPDNYRQRSPSEPVVSNGERFVCPKCGGRMTFSPDGESLICEFCEQEKADQKKAELIETDFVIGISTSAGRNKALATLSFECTACGAIYLLPPETLSLTCPHCDSAYAITESETRELIPPEGIIPFKYSTEKARKLARSWVREVHTPDKAPHLSDFTGIYLPAWTFDIAGYVRWRGTEYEEEHFIEVSGKEIISYDDIFIPASAPLPPYFSQLLKQFHADDVVPYKAEYTATWLAETYKISMSDAALEARSVAFNDAKKTLSKTEKLRGITGLRFASDEITLASYKLVLVPVFLGHFTVNSESHALTINGMTGTVFGPKPPGRLKKFAKWLLED
jgi:DNA-directed RNA polymerase subunit RPC12/RpoP